jgi:hypothetical protein
VRSRGRREGGKRGKDKGEVKMKGRWRDGEHKERRKDMEGYGN